MIWAEKVFEEQGYPREENVLYQCNQSTIRFKKNGRKSCGPNSRHIDIRYFFIKDRIGIEGIKVKHCPTEQMLADFFMKPLPQGSLFRKFREVVMGHKHINSLKRTMLTPSRERVGKDSLLVESMRNGVNGQTKDENASKLVNSAYADIVKRETLRFGF
eukprot:scaffold151728_cov64-Attheya_sp.AAC.2